MFIDQTDVQNLPEIAFDDLIQYCKNGNINFYNIYDADLSIITDYSTKYYNNNPQDNIDAKQDIDTCVLDIELYIPEGEDFDIKKDIKKGIFPVNAITICNDDKILYAYYMLLSSNMELFGINPSDPSFDYGQFITDTEARLKSDLIKLGTIDDEYQIKLQLFTEDNTLLQSCWKQIHEYDPMILTGWNSDNFDYPYMYFRLCHILGVEEASKVMTQFGTVENRGNLVKIPGYVISDLMYMYKPRSEGGLV